MTPTKNYRSEQRQLTSPVGERIGSSPATDITTCGTLAAVAGLGATAPKSSCPDPLGGTNVGAVELGSLTGSGASPIPAFPADIRLPVRRKLPSCDGAKFEDEAPSTLCFFWGGNEFCHSRLGCGERVSRSFFRILSLNPIVNSLKLEEGHRILPKRSRVEGYTTG